MLLVIDNYDSFTFNLVQYFGELAVKHPISEKILVERNDAISVSKINDLNPDAIVLSPGPGDPNQTGECLEDLNELAAFKPILGGCLGHQAIAQTFGGKIIRANELMHGKTSKVFHNGKGIFADISDPLVATRYHSLIADKESFPKCLEVTAWLKDGTIMGLRHRNFPHLYGVQFHPESVLTESGHDLLSNFLGLAES